jgi:hypothetical protein
MSFQKEFKNLQNSIYGVLSEKTYLRVNKKSYFLGLGCLGFGHVASLS